MYNDRPYGNSTLGVMFVSDDVDGRKLRGLYKEMDRLTQKAKEEFDVYLTKHGLEQAMGIVIPLKKGDKPG